MVKESILSQLPLLFVITISLLRIQSTFAQRTRVEGCDDSCIDRSQYKTHAIVHGRDTDPYWRDMRSAMQQTARVMGIDFDMTLYGEDAVNVPQIMARDIRRIVAQEIRKR